jgi:3-methyladenine DNA glycosylase AlkC
MHARVLLQHYKEEAKAYDRLRQRSLSKLCAETYLQLNRKCKVTEVSVETHGLLLSRLSDSGWRTRKRRTQSLGSSWP